MGAKPQAPFSAKFEFKNLPIILFFGLLRLFSYIPFPLIYFLGLGIGEILYWSYVSRRQITKRNLSACFPELSEKKINALARHHFHSMTIGSIAMTTSWWASPNRIQRLVNVHNREVLDEIMTNNQNVILLAPHFISLEFLFSYFSTQFQISTMYQKHKNPVVDKFIYERRSRLGMTLYNYRDTSAGLIKSIRRGQPFYYLPDQDPGRNGVFAKFYKIETATYPSLNRIAELGNACVVPCMAKLRRFGTGFDIYFDPPLKNYPTGDDIEDATQMNKAIERLISYAPAQYFWSHRRFKTRPEGEEAFYK